MGRSLWIALLALGLGTSRALAQGGSANPLTVDGGLVLWTLFVFGLLLYVLKRSAWPVLLGAVRERERRLEQQIAAAEQSRAEAAALLEQHRALLNGAKAEAQELVAKAKAVADRERETLLAKARQEYDELLVRARKDIGDEREKAVLALRREAVDLSIAAASKLLEAKLDSDSNRRLVTDYLAGLAERQ